MRNFRNYKCQHYSACLGEAARTNRKTLPCAGCTHERAEAPITLDDLAGCIGLLLVVAADEAAFKVIRIEGLIDSITRNLLEFIVFISDSRPWRTVPGCTRGEKNGVDQLLDV